MALTREFLFSSALTGAWYPGFLNGIQASAGQSSGDAGVLVREMETHLGLRQGHWTRAQRVITAERAIREYHPPAGRKFFAAASFEIDPEGTAARLLEWRDALLFGGWSGDRADLPGRLGEAMDALDAAGPAGVIPGLADRMLAVCRHLDRVPEKIFDTVYLLRGRDAEPPLVRRLCAAVENTGTTIAPWPLPPWPRKKGDLAGAWAKITGQGVFEPKGDGSLLRLVGGTPYETAEALAAWLAANGTAGVVMIADASLREDLDAALRRQHVPGIGASLSSPFRSALQVLPLSLSLQWKPLNPVHLLEFLQLPISPIPAFAGRILAEAVAERPGIGGPAWRAAMDACREAAPGKLGQSPGEARDYLQGRCDAWLPSGATMLGPAERMPAARAIALCDAVTRWARARKIGMEDAEASAGDAAFLEKTADILAAAINQAESLRQLVEMSGLRDIDRIRLMKMTDAATGEGMSVSLGKAEEGSVIVVPSPEAICGPVETVVWWNCTAGASGSIPERMFSHDEHAALDTKGIQIPSPGEAAMDLSRGYRMPLGFASRRVIFTASETILGEPADSHPLWGDLTAGWSSRHKEKITIRPGSLLAKPSGIFPVSARAVEPLAPPRAVRSWRLPSVSGDLRPEESASSLESLLSCPLNYILKYQAKLRSPGMIDISEDRLVMGNVGHRVMEEIFGPGKALPSRPAIVPLAADVLDRVLAEEGTTLLLPGKETILARFRGDMIRSANTLRDFLDKNALAVTDVEHEASRATELGTIRGFMDMVVADRGGRKYVLDLKYSEKGSSNYRYKFSEGIAIQLAVYARIAVERGQVPAAYVSLRDAEIIALKADPVGDASLLEGPSLADTWKSVVRSVRHIQDTLLRKASIPAAGVEEGAAETGDLPDGVFVLDPPCQWCDYSAICGKVWE